MAGVGEGRYRAGEAAAEGAGGELAGRGRWLRLLLREVAGPGPRPPRGSQPAAPPRPASLRLASPRPASLGKPRSAGASRATWSSSSLPPASLKRPRSGGRAGAFPGRRPRLRQRRAEERAFPACRSLRGRAGPPRPAAEREAAAFYSSPPWGWLREKMKLLRSLLP